MTAEKLARIRTMIAEELEVEETVVRPEAAFVEDLGADSLGLMELMMTMEETFGIELPEDDVGRFKTVQDAIDYIDAHAS